MRPIATDLAAFGAESGCRALGPQRVAGRNTVGYSFSTELGRGEARVWVWVDSATGLPVRAVRDEPDFDVDVNWSKPDATSKGTAGEAGAPAVQIKERPNGKRVIGTHAYLYGGAVKLPDTSGAVDAAALVQLQAFLKWAP